MNRVERIEIFLRSLLLQAAWSYGGMQNLGFLLAIDPALRRLHRGHALEAARRRHAAYFNTHPYFAGYALGVAVRMEEDLAAGRESNPKMIGLVKNRMAGPLAALGDSLFWETLRPLFSLSAVAAALLAPGNLRAGLLGLGAFLLAFNLPALGERWRGIRRGYLYGLGVIDVLKSLDLPGAIRRARRWGLFGVGVLSVVFVVAAPAPGISGVSAAVLAAVRATALAAALLAVGRKVSPTRIVYAALGLGLVLGIGGGV